MFNMCEQIVQEMYLFCMDPENYWHCCIGPVEGLDLMYIGLKETVTPTFT
jgi:hypothetical protein